MSLCPSDIRRCRIFPSKKDLKFGGDEAGAPIPSQSTIAINEDPAAMNEDPAMLHVDDGLKAPLLKALDVLDHVDDDGITEESIDHSLLSIMEYLHGMFDGLFGKHSGDAKYFKKYGKMLIIQETDVEEMEIQGASLCYSTSAGQLAGLNLDHRPFLKRIHILVDSKEGAYGADNLHANYHYQVKMADLKQHLKDIANQKVQVRIAGMNGCGVFDGAGICKIGCPTANQPDCIVYTASNPFAVAYSKSKKSDDKGGVSSSEPAFFCAIGKGVHDFRPLVDQLRIDKMHRYLVERGRSDDCGAAQRNQKSTVHFGLSFMNCTNVERGELHYLPSPEITKSLDKEPGIDEDETMSVTMRKSMLSMTQLMDAMCRVFDIPYLYNDQDRTETYASEIIVGNRLEHGIVDICNDDGDQDGLACHVDNQNGRKKGYTMNISYFKYIRNKNVVSPGNKKYYERIHEGGYGRKICDSTLERADNITRLLEDLSVYMSKLPECVVRYDPDMLLNRMKGDVNTEHNDDVVGRKIHMNKSVFFSFYVYVLSGWINRRKVKNVPVSWSELIEAVTTAVRWTTSPSSWANIFNIVTDDDGVMVKVPNEIHLSEPLRRKMNQKMGRKMPKTNTYDSPFPLYILYIFKSIELLGGMAIGKIRRFQPFHGLSHIDLQRETESIRNNLRLINKLVNDTAKAKKNFPRDVETDDELLEWASNIATITRAYITDAAKTIRNGGVLGLGELLCHHFVGILSHGGWIDVAHGLNTSFSKGNGTSDFLLSEYGLDIVKIPKIIDVVARASCFEKFHLHRRPVAENSTCKMGQEWRRGTSTEFLDTVCIANDSFLSDIYEGKLVARRKGGVTTKINSGIVTCADQTTRDRFDFTVMFQSNQQQEVSAQWFQHNFELAIHTFPKSVFKATDNNAKKKRKEQEKIQKEMQKKISTWDTSQQRSSLCSVWKDRSRKWGYVDKSPRRIHNIVKKQAHLLLQEILFHRMLVINHIGEMSSYQIIERIVKQFKKEDGDKLEQLRLEVNKMVIALHDVDNVNEVEHGLKTDSDNWFDEITKRVGRKETLHTKKRKRTLRSIVAETTESDDRGLMDEDFNEKERQKDGIDYDIIDLDPTYQDGDGSTNYFILAGNRLVPTYYALKEVSSNYRINCEINVEIANAAEVNTTNAIFYSVQSTSDLYFFFLINHRKAQILLTRPYLTRN